MNRGLVSFHSGRRNVVAFDGDDTLWTDGLVEQDWERRFKHLAADRLPCPAMIEVLHARLNEHGFSIEGVQRALWESAREACVGKLPAAWLRQVEALPDLCAGLTITPMPHLGAVESLAHSGQDIWIITKGDVVRQAIKLARFGRAQRFARIEIVPRKTKTIYAAILERARVDPRQFTMVGDSFSEDVIPAVRAGGSAMHVPAGRWTMLPPLERVLPMRRVRISRDLSEACVACQNG